MAITIPTDNGVNKNVRSIDSEINYYVNARNFVSFDSMYDKNKTDELNTKEKYFNANKNNIYNLVDNDYILINSSDTYSNDTYYYMEDGTREDPCPICNGDGLISINEKDPSMVSGRLSNNTVVHFKGDSSLIGTICKVKMIESKGFYYLGELVE